MTERQLNISAWVHDTFEEIKDLRIYPHGYTKESDIPLLLLMLVAEFKKFNETYRRNI